MSTDQIEGDQLDDVESGENLADESGSGDESLEKLDLAVEIQSPSACERHITVTISRDDIERYLDDAFSEMMATAAVPGFRTGRAPRKVVEGRFRQDVTEQIKGSLLMDSLSQISEEQKLAAIGEPDLDLSAVEVPQEGPMTFEFRLEVRPDFDVPNWKGMELRRPSHDFTEKDIDQQLDQMLARFGQLVPYDGEVGEGDYLTVNITSTSAGKQVASEQEQIVRVRPTLSFIDGKLEGFADLVAGVKAKEKRSAEITLTEDAPNEALRGEKVSVEFEVLEAKNLKLPELTAEFLQEIGDYGSEEELRDAVRKNLQRQLEYRQQQIAREQITASLTKSADWELPPGLLQRQTSRELERATMELQRSGFSEAEIRARENQLKQNSTASTATALKEHFILEKIAEEEEIDVEQDDYEKEVALIALQSGESPRRVRAQLEKRGLMDVLRNQIIERKVLERVQAKSKFKDEEYEPSTATAEAIQMAAGGGGTAIPDVTEVSVDETEESE